MVFSPRAKFLLDLRFNMNKNDSSGTVYFAHFGFLVGSVLPPIKLIIDRPNGSLLQSSSSVPALCQEQLKISRTYCSACDSNFPHGCGINCLPLCIITFKNKKIQVKKSFFPPVDTVGFFFCILNNFVKIMTCFDLCGLSWGDIYFATECSNGTSLNLPFGVNTTIEVKNVTATSNNTVTVLSQNISK